MSLQYMCGDRFFRVNRQILWNRAAVKEASHQLSRKLSVGLNISFPHTISMGKEKVADFLDWLGTH